MAHQTNPGTSSPQPAAGGSTKRPTAKDKAAEKAKRKTDKALKKRDRALARSMSPHLLSRARLYQAAWTATVIGVGLIVAGLLLPENFLETVAVNLGSTILAIGLVSLAYERWVREAFTRELVSLVDLSVNVHGVGLLGVYTEDEVAWADVLGKTENLWVTVQDASWLESRWSHVLTDAGPQLRRIVLTICQPDGPVGAALSARTGGTEAEVAARLQTARRTIERLWSTAKSEKQLQAGSSLQIRYVPESLHYEHVRTDEQFILLVSRARGRRAGERAVALVFNNDSSRPTAWWRQQVDDDLDKVSTAFDEVM